MLPIAVALLIGNLCFQQLSNIPDNIWTWLLIPLVPLFILYPRWRWPAAMAAGFLWPLFCLPPSPPPPYLMHHDLEVIGKIDRVDKVYSRYALISFAIEDIVHPQGTWHGTLQLRWTEPLPRLGERWRLTIRLAPFTGVANPGGFDYRRWAFVNGLQVRAQLLSAEQHLTSSSQYSVNGFRQRLADRLQQTELPWNNIMTALAIGDRSRIDNQQWQVFRNTGTSHLIAISGLHIGLIAALAFWLGQRLVKLTPRLAVRVSAPKAAAPFAISAALGYALLAGFSLPTQRACIMVICVMAAIYWQRPINPLQGLAMALTGVLIIDPFCTLSSGFWLSFGAVAVILFQLAWRQPAPSVVGGWLSLQMALSLALLPTTLFFFGLVSISGPIANLIAIPWVGIVTVPLTLLGCLLPDSLAMIPLTLASLSLQMLWSFLEVLDRWPVWLSAAPPLWSLPLIVAGALWLLTPRGFPARHAGLLLWLPMAPLNDRDLPTDSLRLTLLDVGRGLSVVIEKDHDEQRRTLIVDAGPARGNTGQRIIIPYLRQQSISTIDTLLISHLDGSHYGGARSLLKQYQPKKVMTSSPGLIPIRNAIACHDQHWQWGNAAFTILSPNDDRKATDNHSCVLQIIIGTTRILLPGDIGVRKQKQLAPLFAEQKFRTLLIAPKQSPKYTPSANFLEALDPQMILFSGGPSLTTSPPGSWAITGSRLLSTTDCGAITVTIMPNQPWKTACYRKEHRYYWNQR